MTAPIPLLPAAVLAALASLVPRAPGDGLPTEADHYRVLTLPTPEGVALEVSGIALLADGRPLVCTRMGEVYVVERAYSDPPDPIFHKFAEGLQEPLGLLVAEDGWIYVTQRGELSRMRDRDGDDRLDELETVCDRWRISGNYHEYLFGPRRDPEGNLWITTNRPFGEQPFGRVRWRGFALRITPEGEMLPTVCGLRSPAGVEVSPWGDVFYTDNQGEWCGASKLALLEPGSFQGHPHGLDSCHDPLWPWPHPGAIPGRLPMPEVRKTVPSFRLPAVWFPYDKMGKSPAGFVWDRTGGAFGPFEGQVFVTDQHHAWVHRVTLEQVNGHWQGACYPFREGLASGAVRLAWGPDGSLLVGMTNRGWGSRGVASFGFQRIQWTGAVPFEVHAMRAEPDGFTLDFTRPVDRRRAADPASFRMTSYTYLLHSDYGSPEVETQELTIERVAVAEDARSARLFVKGLRAGYVHELHLDGVRSAGGLPLLHAQAYYTLVEIPR